MIRWCSMHRASKVDLPRLFPNHWKWAKCDAILPMNLPLSLHGVPSGYASMWAIAFCLLGALPDQKRHAGFAGRHNLRERLPQLAVAMVTHGIARSSFGA